MIQISFYKNGTSEFIKEWPNWTGELPAVNDVVVLHYGDNYEEERPYLVKLRVIDGLKPDRIRLYIEELRNVSGELSDEDIEELRQEMERLSPISNPALDITIEDCKADLNIRAYNICRKNGIRTLRDLTLLHKTDWLKFRNSGKKSLECIDDLLTKHGLTWAKYE